MKNEKKVNIYYLTAVGLMAALVFIGSKLSIEFPVQIGGSPARVHFGNGFCIFAGLILGPLGGGFAAGIGSALFDLTDPRYIASLPFTFVFKFILAFVAGKIAYRKGYDGKNPKANLIGAALGSVAYIALYLSKTYFTNQTLLGMEVGAALIQMSPKIITSCINGVVAVITSVPLGMAIRRGLESANIMEKIRYSANK